MLYLVQEFKLIEFSLLFRKMWKNVIKTLPGGVFDALLDLQEL
jgi:hypothetical protein